MTVNNAGNYDSNYSYLVTFLLIHIKCDLMIDKQNGHRNYQLPSSHQF